MTVNYCKYHQVATPIASAVPDVVLLLEEFNTLLDTWYASIDLANPFSFFLSQYLLAKTIRSSLLFVSKVSRIPSLSYLRDISTL